MKDQSQEHAMAYFIAHDQFANFMIEKKPIGVKFMFPI